MNVTKGNLGETCVHTALTFLNFKVEEHVASDKGLDVTSIHRYSNVLLNAEVLNWYGGYIHTYRFNRIIDMIQSKPAHYQILFNFGVQLTIQQLETLKKLGIQNFHLGTVTQENLKQRIKQLIRLLKYRMLTIDKTNRTNTITKHKKCVITYTCFSNRYNSFFIVLNGIRCFVKGFSVLRGLSRFSKYLFRRKQTLRLEDSLKVIDRKVDSLNVHLLLEKYNSLSSWNLWDNSDIKSNYEVLMQKSKELL